MHNPYEPPRRNRQRPLAWMVGAGTLTVACLGLAALAGRHWLRPEAGIVPSPSMQQAEVEKLNALLDTRSRAPAVDEPATEPPAPLIPWAWLDEANRAEPLAAIPNARAGDPSATEMTASAGAGGSEQRDYISRGEIQSVAGTDGPDAGAAPAAAKLDAAAPSSPAPLQSAPEPAAPPAASQPDDSAALVGPPGESCGLITCEPGYGCCNPSCGVCVAPGDNCDPTPCESRIQTPVSFLCGRSTCSVGEVCCNPSCGICVAPGETCDQSPCDNAIQYPVSPMCGRVTCSVGEVCCNPSCGICVAPGETCSQQWCE